jgi:hypothetical protein
MGGPVQPQGVQSGITQDDLRYAPGGGVLGKDRFDIFSQGIKQEDLDLFGKVKFLLDYSS